MRFPATWTDSVLLAVLLVGLPALALRLSRAREEILRRSRAELYWHSILWQWALGAALLAESRKHPAHRVLRSVPGLGPIRVALLLARMHTPCRFRTKRQLWAYAGLPAPAPIIAVVHGRLERTRQPPARPLAGVLHRTGCPGR